MQTTYRMHGAKGYPTRPFQFASHRWQRALDHAATSTNHRAIAVCRDKLDQVENMHRLADRNAPASDFVLIDGQNDNADQITENLAAVIDQSAAQLGDAFVTSALASSVDLRHAALRWGGSSAIDHARQLLIRDAVYSERRALLWPDPNEALTVHNEERYAIGLDLRHENWHVGSCHCLEFTVGALRATQKEESEPALHSRERCRTIHDGNQGPRLVGPHLALNAPGFLAHPYILWLMFDGVQLSVVPMAGNDYDIAITHHVGSRMIFTLEHTDDLIQRRKTPDGNDQTFRIDVSLRVPEKPDAKLIERMLGADYWEKYAAHMEASPPVFSMTLQV